MERLLTNMIRNNLSKDIKLLLFDKNKAKGYGCHNPDISDNLLVNTISDQITMYFGKEMEDFGLINEGPSFYQWSVKKNKNVKKNEYLPRVQLSKYLEHFYTEQISRMVENNIPFEIINDEVIDVTKDTSIKTINKSYQANTVVLCLGHQNREIVNENYCDRLLNTSFLKNINKKSIAIQGLGLTSLDVLIELTEGKGGIFKRDKNNKLTYLSSGKEPKIYIYSRSGLFLSGRSYNEDTEFIYKPVYFTIENIKLMKEKKEKLDFELDILPLLNEELEYAYRMKTGKSDFNINSFWKMGNILNTFSEETLNESFLEYLDDEIKSSLDGKFINPIKFCQDIIRDTRDIMRFAVENEGLTSESHEAFIQKWQPIFNRICVGPPYIRLEQLRALISVGVCSIKHVKNPKVTKLESNGYLLENLYDNKIVSSTKVDYLIKARMPSMDYHDSDDLLITNLRNQYKLYERDNFLQGGLKISKNHNIIGHNNEVHKNIFALGLTTEGSKYFTLVLGRPKMVSTFLLDNNKIAESIIKEMDKVYD